MNTPVNNNKMYKAPFLIKNILYEIIIAKILLLIILITNIF